MQEARGVGLAAPQVGILRRVLVYQAGGGAAVALVNPRVVATLRRERTDGGGLPVARRGRR